jgi:SAM domain (Sterile alpha motif)
MQIAEWLKKLGMSEYAQRFDENRIDFSVLRDLTDQDLKDLGIILGDRRKMLRAIGELDVAVPAATERSNEAASHSAAERRQVTVMSRPPRRPPRPNPVAEALAELRPKRWPSGSLPNSRAHRST